VIQFLRLARQLTIVKDKNTCIGCIAMIFHVRVSCINDIIDVVKIGFEERFTKIIM